MNAPTICGTRNQIPWSPCWSTIADSESEPVVITTPSRARPCAASYEISWAAARMAPRNEYFETDAQPPSRMP
ncbi:unannotated protein [freshwater metagenome]|uniref:Unannotated protein n=1 Tax=freshwater metagenome TaxID=449393 RepID=A0A6J7KK38_9ZZZZ